MQFQNRSRIHSLTTIFPAHTPDKQQPPQPGPCAVSLRLLCASLALHLLTLHSSLVDASREQSQQVLLCWYHPMTPQLTGIKSIPSNILEAHRIWPDMGSECNSFSSAPAASWLSLEHKHSPALVHLPWRLLYLERTSPSPPCGHSFMFFTSLLKGHLFNEAHCPA